MKKPLPFASPLLRRFVFSAALAGFSAFALLGHEREARAQVVVIAPPVPRFEVVAPAPTPGYFWVPGYWGWAPAVGYTWRPGYWNVVRPGYAWAPSRWSAFGHRWHFRPGRWHRRW